MKVRQGLVSNSSSSSFVVLGIKLSKEAANKLLEDVTKVGVTGEGCDYDEVVRKTYGLHLYTPSSGIEGYALGLQVAFGIEDGAYVDKPISGLLEEIKAKAGLVGVEDQEIRIYVGVRY